MNRKIERILIVFNKSKDKAEAIVSEMKEFFDDKCLNIMDVGELEHSDSRLCADLAFSIGGDGTVLTCCRALSDCESTPIIAVNLGTFGYITEVEADRWKETYIEFAEGRLDLSKRKMLSSYYRKPGQTEFTFFSDALNDIVISGSGISKVLKLDMFINGCFGGAIRSDGVIVASPTGSTAYSMAAGGPVLDPYMDAMIINPICPFSLSNRPIVVSGGSTVSFLVKNDQRTGICLNADGQVLMELGEGDAVKIVSEKKALFVNPGRRSFFEVVREKLRWDGGIC
ncbi:MAG: NAD(+)/NADH kinase [Sphaerochaetaceae bacterium]|nr:NAD(+)/NADH kinase [Sphaerochaetaceae bacterium]NLY06681.1 NAD(+)/NADH kinase [Spirochaetales bacterium]